MRDNWKQHLAILLGTCLWIGCTGEQAAPPAGTGGAVDTPPPATVDAHAHPSEGPHHGSLIELGNEEYHAELVHDDKSVTIYVLDAAAKTAVPIDATEVKINLKHDGTPEQYTLAAQPDTGDPAGKSSRFVSQDAELAGHLDEAGTEPRLVLSIDGKQFNGDLAHDHEAGHDHPH